MSGGFSIPGLGEARRNEVLPTISFAPDILTATASQTSDKKPEDVEVTAATDRTDTDAVSQRQAKEESPKIEDVAGCSTQDVTPAPKPVEDAMDVDETMAEPPPPEASATAPSESQLPAITPSSDQAAAASAPVYQVLSAESGVPTDVDNVHITDALDAALMAMSQPTQKPQPANNSAISDRDPPQAEPQQQPQESNADGPGKEKGVECEQAEWEADSSPYESSSESSSSDDSSDEDDDSDSPVLGLDETVRMLMEEADGSDDEGEGGGGAKAGKSSHVRSKNELPEWVPPKPDVVIPPDAKILPLGTVSKIVGTTVLIAANEDGEDQVLDVETVVCRADRSIVAAIADVIGNVLRPLYILHFSTAEDLEKEGLEVGTEVFYPPDKAAVVLTRAIRRQKGCDASNLHDEEVPAHELEFSDDEEEQKHKRDQKARKRGGRGGASVGGRGGLGRDASGAGRPGSASGNGPSPADVGLNYDEEEDGPYKPLTRPANFGMGGPPPAMATAPETGGGGGGSFHDRRGRGGGRGGPGGHQRGNRGRGGFRGGRGGSFEGHSKAQQQSRHQNNQSQQPSFPLPSMPPPPQQHQQPLALQQPGAFQISAFPPPPLLPLPPQQQQTPYPPLNLQYHPPQSPGQQQSHFPPPPQPPQPFHPQANTWSGLSALYSNPALLQALQHQFQQQQQQQQHGQGQQRGYAAQPPPPQHPHHYP